MEPDNPDSGGGGGSGGGGSGDAGSGANGGDAGAGGGDGSGNDGTTVADALAELRAAATDVGGHALDAQSVARARARVARAVAALRDAAAARSLWGAGAGVGADRVAHVAADAAQSARHRADVAEALLACRDLALRGDPFAPPHCIVLHHVKAAAEAAGAQAIEGLPEEDPAMFPDAQQPSLDFEAAPVAATTASRTPGPLLTVYAKMFLADFQFYPHDLAVHFRHLSADGREIRDPEIDADFVRLVRNEDFASLKHAFEMLIALEDLDARLRPVIRLKDALHVFEDDLLAMQAEELAAVPGSSAQDLRVRGHGSIQRSAHGLRIGFATGYDAVLAAEEAAQLRDIVTSTTGPELLPLQELTTPRSLPVAFQFTASPHCAAVRAQFVLILEEPLLASTSFAAELERISGAASKEATAAAAVAAAAAAASVAASLSDLTTTGEYAGGSSVGGRPGNASGSVSRSSLPTIEGLLVPSMFDDHRSGGVSASQNANKRHVQKRHWMETLSGGTEVVAFASLPNGKHMTFSYSRNDCSPGVAIHRIPVTRPHEVHVVLKLLRQQLVFNALFASCFGTASSAPSACDAELQQPVEVVVCDPPNFIHFGAFDAAEDNVLGVAVTIGPDGDISARIRSSGNRSQPCSDEKASALFRLAYNAPLALHGILTIVRRNRAAEPQPAATQQPISMQGEPRFAIS